MRGPKRRFGRRDNTVTIIAVAFGAGLFLSLFCSVRFALFLAAIALIIVGTTCRP